MSNGWRPISGWVSRSDAAGALSQVNDTMRVAVIHEWLVNYAGSERVLEQILLCYPDADLFSLVDFLPDGQRNFIQDKSVTTSFIQKLPKARTHYRSYLPLMPLAVEQLNVSGYDLVISSSHAVAKGVLTGPDQVHVCYCHSPIRYAWDLQHQYLHEADLERGLKSGMARALLHYVRLWDTRTANGVDAFVANSSFIARRIAKVYGRQARVIYPPVDVAAFSIHERKEEYYLAASRMVPYKKMPMIVEAFASMPDKRLVVIGDGPEFEKCKVVAGRNVELLGYQPLEVLRHHMQRAKAFIFGAQEDFGIIAVEAQACGTPVIAYGKGGALETVVGLTSDDDNSRVNAVIPTGLFYCEQSVAGTIEAVRQFEKVQDRFVPLVCRENAMRFSPERFRAEFSEFVGDVIESCCNK